jgi:ketosteroid isomerase-like protein
MNTQPAKEQTSVAARNKRLVETFIAAQSAGRLDDAWSMLDPDGTWWMLTERRAVPIATYVDLWNTLITQQFPDGLVIELKEVTAEGEYVAARAESHGVMDNGVAYNNIYFFQFRIVGDKIVQAWEHGDTQHVWNTLRSRQTSAPGQPLGES